MVIELLPVRDLLYHPLGRMLQADSSDGSLCCRDFPMDGEAQGRLLLAGAPCPARPGRTLVFSATLEGPGVYVL